MKIMVIGSGGREDALVWKLLQDLQVTEVICCPGNAGIEKRCRCIKPLQDDPSGYLEIAKAEKVDLTVVGPEAPLVAGIVDLFTTAGLLIFGPNKEAAKVTEGSKVLCKRLLAQARVPTARFFVPENAKAARQYIKRKWHYGRLVIKADGLCGGKGVRVCHSVTEALAAIDDLMVNKVLGSAGERVVIEKRLYGTECSFIVVTDGFNAVPLAQARDYKHQFDGNKGRMTGGMGGYSPTSLKKEVIKRIMVKIVYPTLAALRSKGIIYRGAMYFGLMLAKNGPKVLEINCRFGDPETQVILPLLQGSLLDLLMAVATDSGKVGEMRLKWSQQRAVGVVLAAPGYGNPEGPMIGQAITGLKEAEEIGGLLFYAGVKKGAAGELLTSSGRVLIVVGLRSNRPRARERAYAAASVIGFAGGKQFRTDIGL